MTDHKLTKTKTVQNKKLAADSVISQKQKYNAHDPVLKDEVLRYLDPSKNQTYVDMTAGYGGHARLVSALTQDSLTLIDRDSNAINFLQQEFKQATIIKDDFGHASQSLLEQGMKFDLILADIGLSSPHLDNPNRGFSFMNSGPLDMRMDQEAPLTAEIIVNTYKEAELIRILREYGEERFANSIARKIIASRPLSTTDQLAEVVTKSRPRPKSKHAATQTFQALRIEVNQELKQLQQLLVNGPQLLQPGGRLAIITFHSLEDRLVKHAFSELGQDTFDSDYLLLTKKPVMPSTTETVSNPRARSAKLRVLQRK